MKLTKADNTTEMIGQISKLILDGIASWMEAGRLIARGMDEDDKFAEKLCTAIPGMSEETVRRFEAMGREMIVPELAYRNSPGARRLMLLGPDLQRKYLAEAPELLIQEGKEWTTLRLPVDELTTAQARQVFDRTGARSLAGQRAWVEDHRAKCKMHSTELEEPYQIVRGRVHVRRDTILSARDLALLIAKLEE